MTEFEQLIIEITDVDDETLLFKSFNIATIKSPQFIYKLLLDKNVSLLQRLLDLQIININIIKILIIRYINMETTIDVDYIKSIISDMFISNLPSNVLELMEKKA